MKLRIVPLIITVMISCNSPETNTDTSDSTSKNQAASDSSVVSGTDNVLTDSEKSAGWQLLFDGSSKNGWHVFNNKTDGSAWKIENGTLHLDPKKQNDAQTVGGGDMLTTDEYENFHLKLDWKVDKGGNSGILLFVKEDPRYERTWHTGLEMQVLDNEAHPDAKIKKHRAGDLYDLVSSSPETVKPALEWNSVEVVANNGQLEFTLNGTRVVSTKLRDDNWKKLVEGSKFKKWPDFAKFTGGKIGLQDHGNKVWFKNIKIKKL
jgi:hypothetical protein